MKVAVYCRVACADQLAMDKQMETVMTYAKEQGYHVVRCITDNGVSGFQNKTSITQLVSMAKEKQIEAVVCQDPSRLTRDYSRYYTIERAFTESGCKVVFLPPYETQADEIKGVAELLERYGKKGKV